MPSLARAHSEIYQTLKAQRIHDLALRHFQAFGSKTAKDLALETGFSEHQVSLLLKRPEVQAILKDLREQQESHARDISERYLSILSRHVDQLDDILSDELVSPATKAKIIFGLGDRLGFGPIQKIDPHVDSESLLTIKRRAADLIHQAEKDHAVTVRQIDGSTAEYVVDEVPVPPAVADLDAIFDEVLTGEPVELGGTASGAGVTGGVEITGSVKKAQEPKSEYSHDVPALVHIPRDTQLVEPPQGSDDARLSASEIVEMTDGLGQEVETLAFHTMNSTDIKPRKGLKHKRKHTEEI